MNRPTFAYSDNIVQKDPSGHKPHLVGCTVTPTDGSYSVLFKGGELRYSGCINDVNYKVIAERGRFPTDCDFNSEYVNDIMMVRIDDPTIVVFCQSRFLKIVSNPNLSKIVRVVKKLESLYPQIVWSYDGESVLCEVSLNTMHALVSLDRRIGINVRLRPNGYIVVVTPKTTWDILVGN